MEYKEEMSPTGRVFVAILLLSTLTIELGGQFLISILQRKQKIARDSVQFSLFRAGHAHAGVLVILAIVVMPYVDVIDASNAIKMMTRLGFAAAPVVMSAGFFAAGGGAKDDKPGSAIVIVYLGGLVLAASLFLLAIKLLAL